MRILLFSISLIGACLAEPELKLINVVFRHGDRTPAGNAMYPNDPYINSNFYPMGIGGLTNNGKRQIYKLGELLRARYRSFLGEDYLPSMISATTTNYDRTKMSLQLVLAGLFPPSDLQKWHRTLNWQPVSFTSLPNNLDDLLAVTSQPAFHAEKARVGKTEFIQNRLKQYKSFISRLEKLTGSNMTDSYQITKIYDTLYSEWKMNLTLPSWSEGMFPDGELRDAAMIDYDVMMYDKNMTYQLTGKLTAKIRDSILEASNKTKIEGNKLYLYSGHEVNVAGTLKSLQVFFKKHIPSYASAAIIELHKENDKYYVKVIYYHGDSSEVEEMTIPGCSILCPLEKYLAVVDELLSRE